MALRVLLIAIFLFHTDVFALTKSQKVLRSAKSYHAKKQYSRSIKIIAKNYSLKKPRRIPSSSLFLLALNYHKMGRHGNALYFFNQLIKKAYIKKHIQVIRALKREEVYDVEIPKLLNSVYFYMAQSYYALYSKNNRIVNADKAIRFFTICDETDFNNKCNEFIQNIRAKKEYAVKSIKSFEFYISAGSLVFQNSLNLKNNSTGEDNDLVANTSAICYGAGLRYGNNFSGYHFSSCLFSGTATVENTSSSTVAYKQGGVPVAGVFSEIGYYIKPVSDKARLGLSIPIMFRNGSYQEPSGFSFENKEETSYGLSLNSGWEISFLEVQFKLANMQSTNLFAIEGLINF